MEFDEPGLRAQCQAEFESVELRGLFGSARYLVPLRLRQSAYDRMLRRARATAGPDEAAIDVTDFELRGPPLAEALDLVAICR
ncbi:MAG: hypothetical protein ACJ760_04355 [Thermoleophilaceae bacterium]